MGKKDISAIAASVFSDSKPDKPEFSKGDKISFTRANMKVENEPVQAVVEKRKGIDGKVINQPHLYIIEHPNGWVPNAIRSRKFGLDPKKKYLFIREDQLKF